MNSSNNLGTFTKHIVACHRTDIDLLVQQQEQYIGIHPITLLIKV